MERRAPSNFYRLLPPVEPGGDARWVVLIESANAQRVEKEGPSDKNKRIKTTAPRIPAWSPTVVLTGRHPG